MNKAIVVAFGALLATSVPGHTEVSAETAIASVVSACRPNPESSACIDALATFAQLAQLDNTLWAQLAATGLRVPQATIELALAQAGLGNVDASVIVAAIGNGNGPSSPAG